MKKYIKHITIIGLMIISLVECSSLPNTDTSDIQELLGVDGSVSNVNASLQVKVEGDKKSFPLDAEITLLIYNESSRFLLFTGEHYVRLLTLNDGEWIEVANKLTYSGSQTLSPKGTILLDQTSTWAKPQITEQIFTPDEKVLPLRIVVVGEIVENDVRTGEFAAAYVDVDINR